MNEDHILTDISVFIMVLVMIYIIYTEYMLYYQTKDDYILEACDFTNNEIRYEHSNLYQYYKNLPDHDKIFLDDYINYIRNKHCENKPRYKKKISKLKNNIIYASVIGFIFHLSYSSLISSVKKNTAQHFITGMLTL